MLFTNVDFSHIIFYNNMQKESYMAYYNGNYRSGQRQTMANCPNQAPRQRDSVCCNPRDRRADENNHCSQNEARTFPDTGCSSKDTCLGQPRTTPAQGVAQSCVMPSPTCPVAMAYVAFQAFEELFDESKAFRVGTVFPSLFKPFMAGGKCR